MRLTCSASTRFSRADRAKKQFAHVIRTLRRASSLIVSDRLRREAARIAKYKWAAASGLTANTWYWNADCTVLNVAVVPTSKMTARHLQRRVEPQILEGALGEDINRGTQPMLEYVSSMEEVWNMVEGNPELSDHWRFQQWDDASKYHKYGWMGKVGNFGLRADTMPLRFCNLNTQNADGTWQLQLILPYTNVAATEGIKEQVNTQFLNAPIQMNYIWHRLAMTSLVRDTTVINPEMPFAARDFGGKWQFATNNLTCGTDVNGNPIAVDNSRGNKGKFLADFSFATQSQYPEFAEAFLALREPACIVDIPRCAADPTCYVQDYSSANSVCATVDETITVTPEISPATSTYEIPMNSHSVQRHDRGSRCDYRRSYAGRFGGSVERQGERSWHLGGCRWRILRLPAPLAPASPFRSPLISSVGLMWWLLRRFRGGFRRSNFNRQILCQTTL